LILLAGNAATLLGELIGFNAAFGAVRPAEFGQDYFFTGISPA
jgi:hypothetical protein